MRWVRNHSLSVLACCIAALALAGCHRSPRAPTDRTTCYRVVAGPSNATRLVPLAYADANIETCASHLEARRLIEHRDLIGAYAGLYIFVGAGQITAADALDGQRYRLIAPGQRKDLDAAIRDLMTNSASAGQH